MAALELCVGGQAVAAPVREQAGEHLVGVEDAAGPGAWQGAVQGHGIEHLHLGAASDDEPFDGVEAVELGLAQSQPRQIPAARRRWSAGADFDIECTGALLHPADGAHARNRR